MRCADRSAVGEPGDDRRENESTRVNRIENGESAAALESRNEKHHHCNVTNDPSEKPRIKNVTHESGVGPLRAGLVKELSERSQKRCDDEEDNGERRRSHGIRRA